MELSSQRSLQYYLLPSYNAEPLTVLHYSGYRQYCIEATTREMRDCLPYLTIPTGTVGDLCEPARVTGPAVDLQIMALR